MFYLLPGLSVVFCSLFVESFGWFDFRPWLWECSRFLWCICAEVSLVVFVPLPGLRAGFCCFIRCFWLMPLT